MKIVMTTLMLLVAMCHVPASAAEPPKEAKPAPEMAPFGVRLLAPFKAAKTCNKTKDGVECPVASLPLPHPSFETAVIYITEGAVAFGVSALGSLEDNVYGTKTQAQFKSLLEALTKKYGPPSVHNDLLLQGSIWSEPRDWMAGLRHGERHLSAAWNLPEYKILLAVMYAGQSTVVFRLAYVNNKELERALTKEAAAETSAL